MCLWELKIGMTKNQLSRKLIVTDDSKIDGINNRFFKTSKSVFRLSKIVFQFSRIVYMLHLFNIKMLKCLKILYRICCLFHI
jgi:hypothetical protein